MFEHLDDPEEPVPSRRELGRVVQRANAIRVRRRWVGVLSTCCVLLAASIGFFLGRPSGPPRSTPTDYQFNLVKSPLPLGSPVPTTALVDVQFASPQYGFALAVHRNQVLLAASRDGGSTWSVRNTDLPEGVGPAFDYSGEMEFVGFTGYLWGARTTGGAPLWVSHDDGSTWREAPIGPYVLDVSAIDLDVWALTATCPGTGDGAPCTVQMERSLDGGTTWQDLGPVAVSAQAPYAGAPDLFELARITKDRAYVLSDLGSASQPSWYLEFTDNDGLTWAEQPVPCTGSDAAGAEVAASSTSDLWLLCGSASAGAGAQLKELYRSSDAGANWQLSASTSGGASSDQLAPGSLPENGYVAPLAADHRSLAVLSASTAWLYPARADLFKTSDGGTSWDPVAPLANAGFPSGGEGNVTFLSQTEGWICAYGVGLWHTQDGTHWESLGAS
jgi:hypothetical protein